MRGMVQQRLCLACGTPFEVPATSKRQYCSVACHPKQTHSRRPRALVTVGCARCGKEFERKAWEVEQRKKKGWALYCSTACRDAVKRGRKGTPKAQWVTVTCEMCGKPFELVPHRAKRARYCSTRCAGRAGGNPGGRRVGIERRVARDGYVLVYVPPEDRPEGAEKKARQLEHRYVMFKVLGRWPEAHETVHHINGDRTDNRPENLQLRSGDHGTGHVLRCRCCGSSDIEYVELD